jgi:methylthioribose-1-phosphate isomerase
MRTVSWKKGRVVLVDQTRLPQRFELITAIVTEDRIARPSYRQAFRCHLDR